MKKKLAPKRFQPTNLLTNNTERTETARSGIRRKSIMLCYITSTNPILPLEKYAPMRSNVRRKYLLGLRMSSKN